MQRFTMTKVYRQTDRQTDGRTDGRTETTDDRWSEKLTWAFSSGELKNPSLLNNILIKHFLSYPESLANLSERNIIIHAEHNSNKCAMIFFGLSCRFIWCDLNLNPPTYNSSTLPVNQLPRASRNVRFNHYLTMNRTYSQEVKDEPLYKIVEKEKYCIILCQRWQYLKRL